MEEQRQRGYLEKWRQECREENEGGGQRRGKNKEIQAEKEE